MSATEYTPVQGLPDDLPAGERLLWQGAPDWRSLAVDAFHVRKVTIYFALLVAWRFVLRLYEGDGILAAAQYAAWIVPLAVAGVLLLLGLAWVTAWTTIYTVTSRRVVMRVGIALSMTIDIPFRVIESASLKKRADGTGDIALRLEPGIRAAYLVLWPHARRWHFSRPEPQMRALANPGHVADLLSEALAATMVRASATPAPRTAEAYVPSEPANGLAVARTATAS